MVSVMFARAFAPPLLLPPQDPPSFALPPALTRVVSPPEPPDPPDPPDCLVGASNSSLSILLLRSSDLESNLGQALSPLVLGVALFPLVLLGGTIFASLRSITAVCRSWYQVFPLAGFELWFSIPRLSHPLVTLSKGFVSPKGSNVFDHFAFFWNMPSFILQFPHHEDVMIRTSFRLFLPQYEAIMLLLKLRLFLPQYEDVLFSIGLRPQLLLPQYEAVMILYKLRLLLPQYKDVIQKLWLRSIHVIEAPSPNLPLTEASSPCFPLIEAPASILPQSEGFLCFTDAAWNASSGSCGMGWIFKTQNRVIHQGSASRLHTPSALAAEALAMKSALSAALRMEFTSITVFSDSQVLISLLNTETTSNELQGILHDITFMCRSFLSIKFSFIPRKANMLADSVAKSALSALNVSSL